MEAGVLIVVPTLPEIYFLLAWYQPVEPSLSTTLSFGIGYVDFPFTMVRFSWRDHIIIVDTE